MFNVVAEPVPKGQNRNAQGETEGHSPRRTTQVQSFVQEQQPPNAESVANEVTGEGGTEAQARVFCGFGLIGTSVF